MKGKQGWFKLSRIWDLDLLKNWKVGYSQWVNCWKEVRWPSDTVQKVLPLQHCRKDLERQPPWNAQLGWSYLPPLVLLGFRQSSVPLSLGSFLSFLLMAPDSLCNILPGINLLWILGCSGCGICLISNQSCIFLWLHRKSLSGTWNERKKAWKPPVSVLSSWRSEE